MRHYTSLSAEQNATLFFKEPENLTRNTSSLPLLGSALGATLYIPANRPNILNDVKKMCRKGALSVVICLEDSIPDEQLPQAETNLHKALLELEEETEDLPFIFVRVRTPEHLSRIAEQNVGLLGMLDGFVLPKFENLSGTAERFLSVMSVINHGRHQPLLFMPVLESPNIVHSETRMEVLYELKRLLDAHRPHVLAVRVGATDMSSVYGMRRNPDFTIWHVQPVASAIGDIINVFGRHEDAYTVTGAVWEHFTSAGRVFKPQLRESLFIESDKTLRRELLTSGHDALIREVQLDRVNGILGKTVIHPSHIPVVHSLYVVTHEEYQDAQDIFSNTEGMTASGGAQSSTYRNKMNEIKPHYAWAQKTLLRAQAFGVANPNIDFVDFLEASTHDNN